MTNEEFIKDFERKHKDPHIRHQINPNEAKDFVKEHLDKSKHYFTKVDIMDDKKDGQLLIKMKYLP